MHFLLSNHPSQQLAALAGMLFLQHSTSTAVASARQQTNHHTNHHLRRNLPHSISAPQNRNSLQSLCFDLSNNKHGQFGSRTVQTSQHNAQWLLDYNEVSTGPCTNMEQLLNAREMKEVTYCKQVVRKEYEIKAPRFLENYLYEIGAGRGACMDADGGDEIESLSGRVNTNNNNNNKSKRSDDDTNMVTLCFDLEEYGQQTIDVSKKGAKWFLNNDNNRNKNDDTVQRGACSNNNSNNEKLTRQETELLTYCKHFGSPQNGYEYEIEGPRFLSDYLRNVKGVERGGCRSDATNVSGKVNCNYVGDVFDVDMIVDNDSSSKKKNGNNDSSEGGGDMPRPNVGKKPDKPRPNAGRQSKDENDADEEDGTGDYTCLCQQPNKVMSSIKEQGNRSSSKSRKKKVRPRRSSSSKSKKIGKKKQNKPKPKSSRSKNKPKPEPKPYFVGLNPVPSIGSGSERSFESEASQDESKIQEKLDELPSSTDEKEEEEPEEKKEDSKCDNCICKDVPHSGFVQEPGTSCKKFVQCYDGCVSQHLSCGGGLIFDYNLQVCNWEMLGAFCGPDPDCTSDER